MSTELTSILRNVVKKAADVPAGTVGEDLARMRKRFENCTPNTVVLADFSSSMADLIGKSDIPKIKHLKIALADLLDAHPQAIIIAFGSTTKRIKGADEVPDDGYELYRSCLGGSTNLARAIEDAIDIRPRRTIIISDGVPDSKDAATEAIDRLTGRVDCVYCGPDNHPAVDFLASLARRGGGSQMTFDGCRELSPMIRGLLA